MHGELQTLIFQIQESSQIFNSEDWSKYSYIDLSNGWVVRQHSLGLQFEFLGFAPFVNFLLSDDSVFYWERWSKGKINLSLTEPSLVELSSVKLYLSSLMYALFEFN